MNAMPVEMWKDLFDARIVLEGSLCAECACSLPTNACHFIGLSCGKEIVFRRHHYLSRVHLASRPWWRDLPPEPMA